MSKAQDTRMMVIDDMLTMGVAGVVIKGSDIRCATIEEILNRRDEKWLRDNL